ncbi:hypothetical protein [Staphylococcus pettenkoferi]|uniref:hypothetical protein n=1 Tax=Staphylococcus pettenkoferi TaxID=170573 RepID=UPI002555EEA4|nr:hypothetical protein [Staphylococcus pettenkoferi]MDK7284463.1 hypothetical protein [Staphylococcus pettenkoferi]
MELIELLTMTEQRNINQMTFNGEDVKPLSDFIIENQISYSTLDEADNDLTKMKQEAVDNALDYEDKAVMEDEYNQIIDKYDDVVNEEVFIQEFEVEDGRINLRLS